MKIKLILLLFFISGNTFAQNNFLEEYYEAEKLIHTQEIDLAFSKFKDIEQRISKNDTLYEYALWFTIGTAMYLEEVNRLDEKFEKSLEFGLEALDGIEKGDGIFGDEFMENKYFMIRNIMISHYGLDDFEQGKKWKDKLYKAKENELIPDGIDTYFNYDFFTFEDKNIWGYEWFEALPKDRFSTSFTKVVYYVYSTNPDGSDKDQLYRLHVLMFHGNNENFDYVLDKRYETETEDVSGTFYAYTYQENIDFKKLKHDVKEILKGDLQPDTKRISTKNKEDKINIDINLKY